MIDATEQPVNRLCTACFTGEYPIRLGDDGVLGKHVLEPLPFGDEAFPGERAVTGWTGRQAGSATVPGGAEDALRRP